jgi:hypothetical protein
VSLPVAGLECEIGTNAIQVDTFVTQRTVTREDRLRGLRKRIRTDDLNDQERRAFFCAVFVSRRQLYEKCALFHNSLLKPISVSPDVLSVQRDIPLTFTTLLGSYTDPSLMLNSLIDKTHTHSSVTYTRGTEPRTPESVSLHLSMCLFCVVIVGPRYDGHKIVKICKG